MLIAILLFLNTILSETYYVIQLKGKIIDVATNQPLKAGDKLTPDTKLKFASRDAKAILISSARGRFIISPNPAGKGTDSELTEFVKNVLLSHDKDDYRFMSTRGIESENTKADLESYFGIGKFFIIGKELRVKLDKDKYPVSDRKYMVVKYKSTAGLIEKKLLAQEGNVAFNKDFLYSHNGKDLGAENIKKIDIFIYDEASKYEDYITSFAPVFISENQLNNEFDIQINVFKSLNNTKEEAKKELFAYFNYAYGNTDKLVLESIIDQKLSGY